MTVKYELSKLKSDDDFCIAILSDNLTRIKLGTHYSTQNYQPPRHTQKTAVLKIIQMEVCSRADINEAYRDFFNLDVVQDYIKDKSILDLENFESHAKLYFALYLTDCPLELGKTSRYSHITGKLELGIFATKKILKNVTLGKYLSGNTAPYTVADSDRDAAAIEAEASDDEEPESSATGAARGARLKKPDLKARKDFSVVTSSKTGQEVFFLGPGRFLNHDCDPNVELIPGQDNTITFRTLKTIQPGEELTCYYAWNYFGPSNQACLCSTCERKKEGWYKGQTKPSLSPLLVSVDFPASEASFITTSTSTLASSTFRIFSSTAPLSSSSHATSHADDPLESVPGTPTSSSSVELPAPDIVIARQLRRRAGGELKMPGDDVTLRWGAVEARERRCSLCKGPIELQIRDGDWVEKERCFRCKRHRDIFCDLSWPERPVVSKSNPYYNPNRPPKVSRRVVEPAFAPASYELKSLEDQYRHNRAGFERRNPELFRSFELGGARRKAREREQEARAYRLNPFTDAKSPYDYLDATIHGIRLVRTRGRRVSHLDPNFYLSPSSKRLIQRRQPSRTRLSWADKFSKIAFRQVNYGARNLRGAWITLDHAVILAQKGKIFPLLARFLAEEVDLIFPPPSTWKLPTAPPPPIATVDPQLPAEVYDLHDQVLDDPDAYSRRYPVPKGAQKIRGSLPPRRLKEPLDSTSAEVLVPSETIYDEDGSIIHREVTGSIAGGQIVTVGRMTTFSWFNLTAILRMVGLNLNEQNRVFSTIRTEKKQLYSLPHGAGPPEIWEGVWSDFGTVRKLCDHFGVSYIFKNLFLSSKDLDKLMQSFASDDEEVAQGSGSPQEVKSFPVRPSPKKDVVLSSPETVISPSRMAFKRDADDADDEEDDNYFDLDEIDGRSDHEGIAGVAKVEEIEHVAMDEDGFEVDWYSGDGLKVKDASELAPGVPSPSSVDSPPAQGLSGRVSEVNISMNLIDLDTSDDEDDDSENDVVYISPPQIPQDDPQDISDDEVQIVERDRKGKGKAVDRRRLLSIFDPPPPRSAPPSTSFFAQPLIVPVAPKESFEATLGKLDVSFSSYAAAPSSSPAARQKGGRQNPYDVDDSDDDVILLPVAKKQRRSDSPQPLPPRPRPCPAVTPARAGPSKVSHSPAMIPAPLSGSSSSSSKSRTVVDLTMDNSSDEE